VRVDLFGISNWSRTLSSIPAWWGSARDALYAELGDPKTDAERLRRISPLFHAEQIKAPLMVLHGANDPRVLQVESDEIVTASNKNGAPVEYIVFPDEGHGFVKKDNEIKGYGVTIPRLCPAWRPGMDQLLDVTAYRHSPHEFSDVKSSQPFALWRHNPARRGRRDCDIAAPVARIGRITGNGVHHAITASVFPR